MATGSKQGTFKDPLSKWDDGSIRGAAGVFRHQQQTISENNQALDRIRSMHSTLGSLKGPEAAVMRKLLKDAIAEVAKAQTSSRKTAEQLGKVESLRTETAAKLAALRRWMAETQLSPAEKAKAETLKEEMLRLLKDLSKSNLAKINFEELENSVTSIQVTTGLMSSDLQVRFEQTQSALDSIKSSQDEARKFLEENRALLKSLGSTVLHAVGNLTLRVADRVGFGALNLGNMFRVAGAIGSGIGATARFAGRAYKGETYVQKYLAAKREVGRAGDGDSLTDHLIELVKKSGVQNYWFQRKLLKELEKQGKDAKTTNKEGGLASILSGLTDKLTTFFGSGGLLKTLTSISTLLGPLVAAGRFVLTRAFPVIGAFLGGWKIGSLIYEKYATEIQEAIDSTISALGRAYSWVQGKVGSAKEFASQGIATAKEIGSTVANTVSSTVSSAATNASNAVSPVVDGAKNLAKQGGAYLYQGFDKLSSLVGKVLNTGGNVDLDGLNPSMQSNVARMANDYYSATGRKLTINSANRSMAEQARLYREKPKGMAAPPGSSLHNYGLAVDVPSAQANELDKLGLLKKYGFSRPVSNEKWHIQPQGLSLKAAKAGVYSADFPVNQTVGTAIPSTTGVSTQAPSVAQSKSSQQFSRTGSNRTAAIGSSPTRLSDIPTIDVDDGLLAALNLGVF